MISASRITILMIVITSWYNYRCYGNQWKGYNRHRKSRSRQYNNYNSCSNNSTDIINSEQNQLASGDNERVHNSQDQDCSKSIPVVEEEPIIIIADASISNTMNDRTPLL